MKGSTQTDESKELIEALSDHTQIESVGDGGKGGKVACWLTTDAITGDRDAIKSNLTLLANAHGYEYGRGSLESNGYIITFTPVGE